MTTNKQVRVVSTGEEITRVGGRGAFGNNGEVQRGEGREETGSYVGRPTGRYQTSRQDLPLEGFLFVCLE